MSYNGQQLELGMTLGRLLAGQDRSIQVLERIADDIESLPGKIHSRPAPEPPAANSSARLKDIASILKTVFALALLAAVVAGKITYPEALPLLRKFAGL